jgi:hypothetical protein
VKSISWTFAVLVVLYSSAFADDFRTLDGKEYKDATVTRVEPDGIVVKTKSGISKLYFTQLPTEVHDRFLGNYGSEQDFQARYIALQQQEYDLLGQIGRAERAKACLQSGECKMKKKHSDELSQMAELAAQLPTLHKELDNIRAAKDDINKRLQKAQQPSQPEASPSPPPQKPEHKKKKKHHK